MLTGCNRQQTDPTVPVVSQGEIVRLTDFQSDFVAPRNIDIWLPEGYTKRTNYSVLYMHDGQMLFDSTTTWNKQEWGVDEVISGLLSEEAIEPVIVVGIWNSGSTRHSDYFPRKPYEELSITFRDSMIRTMNQPVDSILVRDYAKSDDYLKFLVHELKPYIDKKYATNPGYEYTYVAGSSMGGLISMYAICEYPAIFGGAACLSTHWPGTFNAENNPIPNTFINYLSEHLPSPSNHRIYFDYGTETLDSLYEPHQLKVDSIMVSRGFSGKNWITLKFEGENHSERSWYKRLDIPIKFLLGRV
jgi:predicted alpha/beta superfamily hydrolase